MFSKKKTMNSKRIGLIVLFLSISILTYCQSTTTVTPTSPTSPMVPTNRQYPITRIIDDDTVVVMTVQQGKDMNKQFVILKENIKGLNKTVDSVQAMNTFLVEYNQATFNTIAGLKVENKELNTKIGQLSDKITTLSESNANLIRKNEMDLLRAEMYKSTSDAKIDLYKSEMLVKTELFNAQLEAEKRNSTHRARQSAILGGLIVGGVAITGALIGSWMPSTWFK
jgi:predicted RNase H-like nuclease (RuvC/YqgF family)